MGVAAEIQDQGSFEPGLKFQAKSLAADSQHTCALTLDGQAYCWGRGNWGKLGHGETATELPAPQKVLQEQLRFVSISAGVHHTCALTDEGDAYCWGNAGYGRLGEGSMDEVAVTSPVLVLGGHKFIEIVSGRRFNCGLTVDQDAYCWGRAESSYSPIGDGTSSHRGEPTLVAGGHKFITLGAGKYHACGITTNYEAYCWGQGGDGRLGNGESNNTFEPVKVLGDHKFIKIDGGNNNTCALTIEGEAWCWGSGSNHRLGAFTDDPEPEPITWAVNVPHKVVTDVKFVDIAVGQYHVCALATDGKAYCWGSNSGGKTGNGSTASVNVSVPTEIVGDHRFVDLISGLEHTCGMTNAGEVYCWGRGNWGQLGNGALDNSGDPVRVLPFGS